MKSRVKNIWIQSRWLNSNQENWYSIVLFKMSWSEVKWSILGNKHYSSFYSKVISKCTIIADYLWKFLWGETASLKRWILNENAVFKINRWFLIFSNNNWSLFISKIPLKTRIMYFYKRIFIQNKQRWRLKLILNRIKVCKFHL